MIQVYHNPNFLRDAFIGEITDLGECVHVANVLTDDAELAFGLTQNIGPYSWDSNPLVEALIPPDERRSTSWGDFIIVNGVDYFVSAASFRVMEI